MKKVIIILIIFSLVFISFFVFKKDEEKENKNISVILETEEGNIESNTFPSKNDYEYLSTECKNTSDNINTTFNEETWKLNLNVEEERIDGKFNCTVHFKENIKPNEPVLDESMVPVYYSDADSTWKVADKENKSTEHKWYDYENKMWANSVTVKSEKREEYKNGSLGTEIKIEDILTMQVWIPRYKYKVWNYNLDGTKTSEPQEIEIKFEEGTNTTGDIKCTDNIQGEDGDGTSEVCTINNEECSDSLCNGEYYTHPAFTFGSVDLTGFWVGKFEAGTTSTCIPATPTLYGEGCNITSISVLTKPNIKSWNGAMLGVYNNNITKMKDNNNIYGFTNLLDAHVIKNNEWGAVAYLSHSKFGSSSKVELNSNENYITGCGPQIKGDLSSGSVCNSYDTEIGSSASTTGNIYGVYDMSGGAWEYVMGAIVSPDGKTMMSGYKTSADQHSGFTGLIYETGNYTNTDGYFTFPEEKYYDKYSYSLSSIDRKRSKLGDAIREPYLIGDSSWYNGYSKLHFTEFPWLMRGGGAKSGRMATIFTSYQVSGRAVAEYGTRISIVVNNN